MRIRSPRRNANLWFDLLAIPADTKSNPKAHAFISDLLGQVIAKVSASVGYANPARQAVHGTGTVNNLRIVSAPGRSDKLYISTTPMATMRVMTRAWSKVGVTPMMRSNERPRPIAALRRVPWCSGPHLNLGADIV